MHHSTNVIQTGTKEFPYYTTAEVAAFEGVTTQRLRQRSIEQWRGFPALIPVTATLSVVPQKAYERWVRRETKAGRR